MATRLTLSILVGLFNTHEGAAKNPVGEGDIDLFVSDLSRHVGDLFG